AASGYFLAEMNDSNVKAVVRLLETRALRDAEFMRLRRAQLSECDGGEVSRFEIDQMRPLVDSILRFAPDRQHLREPYWMRMHENLQRSSEGICAYNILILGGFPKPYRRKLNPQGPLIVFGYDYFADHAAASGIATPKLLSYQGLWGGGEEYAYETLNFV